MTVRRMPKRCITAAAKGPAAPYRTMLIEIAAEIVVRLQPKACSSGTMRTLGLERTPAATSRVKKIAPTTIHA
jgi:hypothetical protein